MGVRLHIDPGRRPSLPSRRDPQTQSFLLGGAGQHHIEVYRLHAEESYHVD